jgi:hypothetical protein
MTEDEDLQCISREYDEALAINESIIREYTAIYNIE